jgi:HK97 family phage portal protein
VFQWLFGPPPVAKRDASLGTLISTFGGGLRSDANSVPVTKREVAGLPAWQQGIRIAALSIAKHDLAVWRGRDVDRRRVTTTWQARLFAGEPNERDTWFYVFECTEASLTARNNAVWRLYPDAVGQVSSLEIVHPDCVIARWNRQAGEVEYKILLEGGYWSEPLSPREILHFRVGAPLPGAIWAPSPIDMHRRALSGVLARQQAEAGFYEGGSMKTTAVVFPEQVTEVQAKRWKEVFLGPGGVTEAGQVKVFGGDPRIESIGLSLQDQQFVESQAFSIYDVGRILGVMPSLLWAAIAGGDKPITPEHEEDRWWRYGLQPRRLRIEQTIKHHRGFFGPMARDYPMFAMDSVASDARTESENLVREVQAGILLVDEARARRGLGPLPDGMGQIPQIVPVGGAPNPVPTPVTD